MVRDRDSSGKAGPIYRKGEGQAESLSRSDSMSFVQYEMMELTFTAQAPAGDEVHVGLEAVFSSADEEVSVKGFYAGDGKYKVRFMPSCAGKYTYTVSGIVSAEGSFEAAPAVSHGPVKAVDCHFEYADGTYYYPFGTTAYAFIHQKKEVIEETFASLADAPFNKIRFCVFPKSYLYNENEPDYFAFEKEGDQWHPEHPCFAFWDAFDGILEKLNGMGIQADIILFHPYDRWGLSKLTLEQDLTYLEYITRRVSAYPNVWWSLANEYDALTIDMDFWYAIEEYVAGHDPFHRLLSCHNMMASYDFSRPNVTHASIQGKQFFYIPVWRERFHKPVIIDECCYEGNIPEAYGNITADQMTRHFWRAVCAGGYCTHGECFADPDDVLWWSKGGKLKGESPKRIAFLREIAESLPGPLEPVRGFWAMCNEALAAEDLEGLIKDMPEGLKAMYRMTARMERDEYMGLLATGYDYTVRCADDSAYVFYFDFRAASAMIIRLPEDRKYRIEYADSVNLERVFVMDGASGTVTVPLPVRDQLAVIATLMKD